MVTVYDLSLITTKAQVPSSCFFVCVSTLLDVTSSANVKQDWGCSSPWKGTVGTKSLDKRDS